MALGKRFRGDLEDVKEESGDEREYDVDEEAVVGLETEDSCSDSEEGGSETMEIGKSLCVENVSKCISESIDIIDS